MAGHPPLPSVNQCMGQVRVLSIMESAVQILTNLREQCVQWDSQGSESEYDSASYVVIVRIGPWHILLFSASFTMHLDS